MNSPRINFNLGHPEPKFIKPKIVVSVPVVSPIIQKGYGRLYNWYAATDIRGIAPVGYHVPSDAEWQTLIDFAGGDSIAVDKLKEIGLFHWSDPNNSTNEFNFSAVGGGQYSNGGGDIESSFFGNIKVVGYYRCIREDNNIGGYISIYDTISKSWFIDLSVSIRLIKDNGTNEGDVIIDGDTYHAVTIGTQVWLQENLAVKHYQNGDPILSDFSGTVGAVCAYNNDESNV